VGAEFFSLFSGLRRDRAAGALACAPLRPEHRHARSSALFSAVRAKRCPSGHAGDALFYIGPGVYTIFTRASVIFTALLALAFFPEERFVIRQWRFQLGTLLGLSSIRSDLVSGNAQPERLRGILHCRIVHRFHRDVCWALYGVLIKRPSAQLGSIRSFGIVSFITSGLLLPSRSCLAKSVRDSCGSTGELDSHPFGCHLHYACPRFVLRRDPTNRVALAQTLQLICPAMAMALSAWIFHERLTHAQLWSAAVLLLGAFLAMRVKPVATSEAAENI